LTYFKGPAGFAQLYQFLKTDKILKCPADNIINADYYRRGIYFDSYIMNGAIGGYGHLNGGDSSYKITAFKPTNILLWEVDEKKPDYFNDAGSYPDEGISGRHGKGATVGVIGGSTTGIKVKDWYGNGLAGAETMRGAGIPQSMLPNDLWCNPAHRDGLENN
jgi:hypothetical protein